MVEIEIDGKTCKADPDAMLIEAADAAGIYIPRYCYHKKLTIAANCRMCLVEMDKSKKPVPACATPVSDGMKVFTKSQLAKDAQRSVMEFLLINHPLDCPICDQGGQCELQDISMGWGAGDSQYQETKRSVTDEHFGSLVATEMTRCIHCTRCVRFSREIAGVHDIGATGRGEDTQIGTYVEKTMTSELSGNMIDLCPVGALTSRPFLYKARAWELQSHDAVAPHDCLGSNIHVHTRNGSVMRVVPRENELINENWLSDRDRFSYTALTHNNRLKTPLIKSGHGQWQSVTWEKALTYVAHNLQTVIESKGADQLGGLISPFSTLEECYLLQRLIRGLGSHHIDHRLRVHDVSRQAEAPLFPQLGMSISELQHHDTNLLIGSDIRYEQPLIAHRVRQVAHLGGVVMSVGLQLGHANFHLTETVIAEADGFVQAVAGILKALLRYKDNASGELTLLLRSVTPTDTDIAIAKQLHENEKVAILVGSDALHHPCAEQIKALVERLADYASANYGYLTDGPNSAGAWLAGAVPHRETAGQPIEDAGLDAQAMLKASLRAYFLFNVEPMDCFNAKLTQAALKQADFVVACSIFASDELRACGECIVTDCTLHGNIRYLCQY